MTQRCRSRGLGRACAMLVSLGVIVQSLIPESALPDDQRIRLDSPEQSGIRYACKIVACRKGGIQSTSTVATDVHSSRNMWMPLVTIKLEGEIEVKEVSDDGQPIVQLLLVKNWQCWDDEGEAEDIQLAGAAILICGSGSSMCFKIGDQAVDGYQEELLKIALLEHFGSVGIDAKFGSPDPHGFGATWSVSSKEPVGEWVSDVPGTVTTPDKISGTGQFIGIDDYNGLKCARIEIFRSATGYFSGRLDDYGEIESSDLRQQYVALFPLERPLKRPYSRETREWRIETKDTDEQGKPIRFWLCFSQTVERWMEQIAGQNSH